MDVGRRRRGYALEIPRCSGNPLEPIRFLNIDQIGLYTLEDAVAGLLRPFRGQVDLDAHRQCHVSSR